MNIWLTSDTHFGHANMTAEGPRPFAQRRPFDTIQAMDDALIRNWNGLIAPDDQVYVVGDFCLSGLTATAGYFARLNGRVRVIPGSHDMRWLADWAKAEQRDPAFAAPRTRSGHPVERLPELVTIKLPPPAGSRRSLTLTMCHYQMASWEQSHHGSLHVYGHHHGRRRGLGRSMDIGVDTNDLKPYALNEVVARLLALPVAGKYEGETTDA